MTVGLLESIKSVRMQQKARSPLPRSVFAQVAAIVQQYDLDRDFIQQLKKPESLDVGLRPNATPSGRLSLFPLLTWKKYQLTQEIITHSGNPYLMYVRSPREIGLSRILYHLDASISAETFDRQTVTELVVARLSARKE